MKQKKKNYERIFASRKMFMGKLSILERYQFETVPPTFHETVCTALCSTPSTHRCIHYDIAFGNTLIERVVGFCFSFTHTLYRFSYVCLFAAFSFIFICETFVFHPINGIERSPRIFIVCVFFLLLLPLFISNEK